MWTSINKKLYMFIAIIFLIGLITGVIFLFMMDESSKEIIFLNINEHIQSIDTFRINNIVTHLVILSSLLVLSIFIIGIPFSIFFLFFNGFSIGFIICSITSIFGLKGLLYSLIYIIITKGLFFFFLSVFLVKLIKIAKLMIEKIIYKKRVTDKIYKYLKVCLLCFGIIVLNDIILFFFGIKLINIFNFLII